MVCGKPLVYWNEAMRLRCPICGEIACRHFRQNRECLDPACPHFPGV